MDENQIRQIAQQVYDQNQSKQQMSSLKVNKHIHNGVDSPRINQDNVDAGTYSMCGITETTSETFTLETFPNVSQISLYGVAADALGRKATISGEAFIGNCFAYGDQGGGSVTYIKLVGGTYSNIIQTAISAYFDTTTTTFDTTNVRVNGSGSIGTGINDYMIYVKDAVNVVASMKIVSWTNNTITFQTVLTNPWYVTYFLAMS